MLLETILVLFTGHLLGDFVFQTEAMARNKGRVAVLLAHAATVTGVTMLLLGAVWPIGMTLGIAAGLFVSHALIDLARVRWLPDSARAFLLDQAAHIGVILLLAWAFPAATGASLWPGLLPEGKAHWYPAIVVFVGAVVLCVPAGGVLVGKIVRDVVEGEELDVPGLKNGGRYIGWLERGLVLLLFLIGQPAGIGFLFAAKSILRFGDIKEPSQRKVAEYIIIGTFLSFGWALLVSALLLRALALVGAP